MGRSAEYMPRGAVDVLLSWLRFGRSLPITPFMQNGLLNNEIAFPNLKGYLTQLRRMAFLLTLTSVACWPSDAQIIYNTNNVVVQPFVGSGFSGYVDGVGELTMFNNPSAVVADSSSNLFVWDSLNSRVRKIVPDGTVSTFAGGGSQPTGCGTNAYLNYPVVSMAIDHSNALWLPACSGYNFLIRIGSDAKVSHIDLPSGMGPSPYGVCADSANRVYVADYSGHKIYRYGTNGVFEVFAGSGNLGSADGNGILTSFNGPKALAADSADNIYVWDSGTYLIRRINQYRDVVTIAGSTSAYLDGVGRGASFYSVSSMCVDDSGNMILACDYSLRIMTASTNVTTLAGAFPQSGYTNGAGNFARFNDARGVCISQGIIHVADSGNQRIRQITFNPTPQPVTPANLQLSTFSGLQIIGTVGRTYQIQSSPDMATWSTAATLLLTASPYLWIDQHPVSGDKFYRAFMLP
jgi:hypothetical protein